MLDYPLIEAVAAVLRTGSFEKAATVLHVTPSAVSQRVKLLEERLGTVLVVRGTPCTGTKAGRRLARHGEDVGLLESALKRELSLVADRAASVRIAVTADSLATWFVPAMAMVPDRLFDLVLDDQDHSAEWLRRGEVCAAVSAVCPPIQGCRSRALGAIRYVATCSPGFVARWFAQGVTTVALQSAPTLTFNAKDRLQNRWIEAVVGQNVSAPTHWLPSSQAFIDAAVAGLGWGMNPYLLAAPLLQSGRLVELIPDRPLDVPLFWRWSRAVEPVLADVTAAVIATAQRVLCQPL